MTPNATEHWNPDLDYILSLIDGTGLTRKECATRLGIGERTIYRVLSGEVECSYPLQFTLESLTDR